MGHFARVALIVFSFLVPSLAFAATLQLSFGGDTVSVGDSVTAQVLVTSADEAVNAISGDLTFPTDKLAVTNVSKAASILTLWIQDPSFSNSSGDVNFGGVIPNPGWTGSLGNVVSVRFRTLKAGVATVSFSSASVLANDGNGTNILTGAEGADVVVSSEIVKPPKHAPGSVPTTAPTPKPKTPTTPVSEHAAPLVATTSVPAVQPTSSLPISTSAPSTVEWDILNIPASVFGWYLALLAMILLAAALLAHMYMHYRLSAAGSAPYKRLTHAHIVLREQFSELKASLMEEIAALERLQSKRDLTEEEERFMKSFKKKLDAAQKVTERLLDETFRE